MSKENYWKDNMKGNKCCYYKHEAAEATCSCPPAAPVVPQCMPMPRPNVINSDCCCKKSMKYSLDLLLNQKIKPLIDLGTFTLIGQNFATKLCDTQLKTIPACSDGLITYNDGSDYTSTTISDLIAFSFELNCDDVYDTETNAQAIQRLVRCFLPPVNPRCLCCSEDSGCCNNVAKSLILSDALGDININLNTSVEKECLPVLCDLNVITVSNNIAWFISNNKTIIVACLNNIVQMG